MQNLSTKELNYLKDLMSCELLNAKTCYSFANQETDQAYKQVFNDTATMHQQNYISLLNYMDQITKKQGGQLQ